MKSIDREKDELKKEAKKESPKAVEYLESLAKRNWNAIQKFSRKSFILFGVFFVILLGLGILSVKLSSETQNLTTQNTERIKEAKDSRIRSIKISCEEQNERHAKAKIGIEGIVEKQNSGKKMNNKEFKAQQIVANEFVQALVPSYNCAERIAKLTK